MMIDPRGQVQPKVYDHFGSWRETESSISKIDLQHAAPAGQLKETFEQIGRCLVIGGCACDYVGDVCTALA